MNLSPGRNRDAGREDKCEHRGEGEDGETGRLGLTYIPVCMLSRLSRVRLFATPWTAAHQTPLSMGFSRQEYWSGLPCPISGDISDPGIEPVSLTSALAGGFFAIGPLGKPDIYPLMCKIDS